MVPNTDGRICILYIQLKEKSWRQLVYERGKQDYGYNTTGVPIDRYA